MSDSDDDCLRFGGSGRTQSPAPHPARYNTPSQPIFASWRDSFFGFSSDGCIPSDTTSQPDRHEREQADCLSAPSHIFRQSFLTKGCPRALRSEPSPNRLGQRASFARTCSASHSSAFHLSRSASPAVGPPGFLTQAAQYPSPTAAFARLAQTGTRLKSYRQRSACLCAD